MPSYDDFRVEFDVLLKKEGKRFSESSLFDILTYRAKEFLENMCIALSDAAYNKGYDEGFRDAYNLTPEERLAKATQFEASIRPSKEFVPAEENLDKVREALKDQL